MRLRLPEGSPLANETGTYVLADLAQALVERIKASSARFDRRNGNTYYTDCIDEARRLRKLAKVVPYEA